MVAIVAPIAAVVILGGAWFLNADGFARAQVMIDAISTTDQSTGAARTPDQQFASFKQALSGGELGRQEAVEQLLQFASNSIAPSSVSPQLKQDVYAYALDQGNQLLAQRKNDARLELFMSVFFLQFGQYDNAITHLKNASALSPDKQQVLFQLGVTYIQQGDLATPSRLLKRLLISIRATIRRAFSTPARSTTRARYRRAMPS